LHSVLNHNVQLFTNGTEQPNFLVREFQIKSMKITEMPPKIGHDHWHDARMPGQHANTKNRFAWNHAQVVTLAINQIVHHYWARLLQIYWQCVKIYSVRLVLRPYCVGSTVQICSIHALGVAWVHHCICTEDKWDTSAPILQSVASWLVGLQPTLLYRSSSCCCRPSLWTSGGRELTTTTHDADEVAKYREEAFKIWQESDSASSAIQWANESP